MLEVEELKGMQVQNPVRFRYILVVIHFSVNLRSQGKPSYIKKEEYQVVSDY